MADPRLSELGKVLVANRGEIAVRVIRAARDCGIPTVVGYAEDDCGAQFVHLADEAYAIPGQTGPDAYLDIDALLAVARTAGAGAVHPGYGFLSESSTFASAVRDAGLTWIGPAPESIDLLADKVEARRLARSLGVPLVPSSGEQLRDVADLEAFVASAGLPIVIKAVHGGGGRGMKVVRAVDELATAFESAARESTLAFGRGECFAERYLDRPRHIEAQCLADVDGNVRVLGTRECSVQRRHQKLIEEAPAPFLTDEQTTQIVDASIALFSAAKYVGVGTCEFLVAADGEVTFLEVNTRLQVEHPVTEEAFGVDLVQCMFGLAVGRTIESLAPVAIRHAMEFRITAEDPAAGFLPRTGRLERWRLPSGPGVRVDAGCVEGDVVSGRFDSLLAKLTITGSDRRQVLARAKRALAEVQVKGVATVLPLHRQLLDDPDFVGDGSAHRVHTSWVEDVFLPDRDFPIQSSEGSHPGRRISNFQIEIDGQAHQVKVAADDVLALLTDHHGGAAVSRGGGTDESLDDELDSESLDLMPAEAMVVAPMEGTIVRIAVEEGERVTPGQVIVVVEAMKMELPIKADRDGFVSMLSLAVGDSVGRNEALCSIVAEPPNSQA